LFTGNGKRSSSNDFQLQPFEGKGDSDGEKPLSALTGAEKESLRLGSSLPLTTWLHSKRAADTRVRRYNMFKVA